MNTTSDDGAEQLEHHRDLDDAPPREAVGGEPGDEHEAQRRQELRQTDEPEVDRLAGDRPDLPRPPRPT